MQNLIDLISIKFCLRIIGYEFNIDTGQSYTMFSIHNYITICSQLVNTIYKDETYNAYVFFIDSIA